MPQDDEFAISIIVPCYNAAGTIRATLSSVAQQQNAPGKLELIVVDDASSDASVAEVENFVSASQAHSSLECVLLKNERNLGVSATRNRAIRIARGQYIAFLDADDALHPHFAELMYSAVAKHNADCVVCRMCRVRDTTKNAPASISDAETCSVVFSGDDYIRNATYSELFDSSCAKIFRRQFILSHDLSFCSDLCFGEDTLFSNSAAIASSVIVVLPEFDGYDYYVGVTASLSKRTAVIKRLENLQRLLEQLSQRLPVGEKRLLLRKCCEYLWMIRKFGGEQKRELLTQLLASSFGQELLMPTITTYGKRKHRWIAALLKRGYHWSIRFW